MLRLCVLAAVLWSSSQAIGDEVEENLKKAAAANGPEYVKLRDQLMKTAEEFLKSKSTSGTAAEKVVAMAVLGWKSHGPLYTERSTAKTNVTRNGFKSFDWTSQPKGLEGPLLPLGLEMLFKDFAGQAGRAAGRDIVVATAKRKQFEHTDILFDLLSQVPLSDVESAKFTAQSIAAFPIGSVPVDKLIATLEILGKDEKNGRRISDVLANGLLRASTAMPPAEKEKLVDVVLAEDGLYKSLGPEIALRIAGTIGGPKATKAIEEFLYESQEPEKHLWAFKLLRSSPDGSGTAVLIKYATSNKSPAKARLLALDSLVFLKYTPELVDVVKGVLEDKGARPRVRYEALRTLSQLERANRFKEEISVPLREVIRKTTFGSDDNPDYKGRVDAIKNALPAAAN